jgi:hypothetical protein
VMWRQEDLFRSLGGGANLLAGIPALERVAEAGERAKAGVLPERPMAIPAAPLMHATAQYISFGQLVAGGTVATLPSRRFEPAQLFDEIELFVHGRQEAGDLGPCEVDERLAQLAETTRARP